MRDVKQIIRELEYFEYEQERAKAIGQRSANNDYNQGWIAALKWVLTVHQVRPITEGDNYAR